MHCYGIENEKGASMAKDRDPSRSTNPFGLPEQRDAYPYLWASTRSFHKRIGQKVKQGFAWWVFILL
jgi:hypothetical protein